MPHTVEQILENLRLGLDEALVELRARSAEFTFDQLVALLGLPREDVRVTAVALLAGRDGCEQPLARVARDDEEPSVRMAAVLALSGRETAQATLIEVLRDDEDWHVRQAAAGGLAKAASLLAASALLDALAGDTDEDVARTAGQALQQMREAASATALQGWMPAIDKVAAAAERKCLRTHDKRLKELKAWLLRVQICDPSGLARFGTDLTREAEQGRLLRAHRVDRSVRTLIDGIVGGRQRSFVVLGPPGSGKTALIHEMVHRLREHEGSDWRVLRATATDLMAGTLYVGEWQTKVRELVERLRAGPRLLYVPNISELSSAGRGNKSDMNVASMLAPYIEAGEIAVVGESSTEAFRSGLGSDPSLRRLFATIEVAPATHAETLAILADVRDEYGLEMSAEDLERLSELARLYLPGTVDPGRSVGLLRRLAEHGPREPIRQRDVLAVLASSTGIPVDFLDDAVPLDLQRVRDFLEARVMGQREAVSSVLDLVTLVKSGLHDPSRPYGVLLFVGPTGVGKTELARALAELLFSDASRLIRFDMSEYASMDACPRLIGHGHTAGTLTSAVRERPFSVLLLDEIEKADPSVYNLLLQVFDAGRLTDGTGQTTDFRGTIVVLTSNLGAAVKTESSAAFGAGEPVLAPAPPEEILREVRRWFRPEFVNRLDGVVSFKPLGVETAEQIARREVGLVLQRSGLTRRGISVDVDGSVFTQVLKEGHSVAYGARPLKRTVTRLVLQPVARAIAHGDTPPGSILRLVLRHGRVEVDVVAQGSTPATEPGAQAPGGVATTPVSEVGSRCAALGRAIDPLRRRKDELLALSRNPEFWRAGASARRPLDEVHRLEAVVSAAEQLVQESMELEQVASASAGRRKAAQVTQRRVALAREAAVVERLIEGASAGRLGDAFVRLTLLRSEGTELDAVARLAQMVEGWAVRRGLEVATIDDRQASGPAADTITLEVTGPGALALLAQEEGVHQVLRSPARRGKDAGRPCRASVRVEVLPVPPEASHLPTAEVTVQARQLKGAQGRRIAKPVWELTLLHVPSLTSLSARATGTREQAVRRLMPLLAALHERATSPTSTSSKVVRSYELGATGRVRDRLTGAASEQVARILAGELELLLPQASA